MLKILKVIFFISTLLTFSCQSARETHFIKEDKNYYRIRIKEFAFLSSSRYMSGYYDEKAVDNYFGEIQRPDSTAKIINLNCNNPNSKLLLILSTNSNTVSDQVGALADNERTLEIIARLSNKDKITESNAISNELKSVKQEQDYYYLTTKNLIDRINDSDSNAIKNSKEFEKAILLPYLNSIARKRGRTEDFKTIEDAKKWFAVEFNNYK